MKVRIEKYRNEEIEIAIQLLKDLYVELGEEIESVKFLNKKFLMKITDTGITEIYFAKTNNSDTVGIMTITECQSIYAGGKYGQLDEMNIKPEFRSKNIGSLLVEKLTEIGKEKKWR